MSARNTPMANGTGSRARSIEAYYPFYPPPVYPIGELVRNTPIGNGVVASSVVDERTDKGIVNSGFNRWGERTRYTLGGIINRVFHMRATGQVESSMVQPITNMPAVVQMNDFLYRAAKGYPRNLGLSEKVPTLPPQALGNNPWGQMNARTQITRNVFTNRNYNTVKQVAAKPSAS
jgi:hypothetical protein